VELAGQPLTPVTLLYGPVQLARSGKQVGNTHAIELERALPVGHRAVQVAAPGGMMPRSTRDLTRSLCQPRLAIDRSAVLLLGWYIRPL
jgi:hypothetical protein